MPLNFSKLKPHWLALPRSVTVLRSIRNAVWSAADHLTLPLLMLISTPLLLQKLGVEQYGIWMLVNSTISMMTLMNLGLGDATIKFVAKHRSQADYLAIGRVVRTTLTIYSGMGLLAAMAIYVLAGPLVQNIFRIDGGLNSLATAAVQVGGLILAVKMGETIFVATLRGFERHDLTARIAMVLKVATTCLSLCLALLGFGLMPILQVTLGLTIISTFAQATAAGRLLGSFNFLPLWDLVTLREIMSFGLWSWLQAISGVLFGQADRLLITSMLGTTALAYYSVCIQLAQQVHSLLASATSFMFPLSSAMSGNDDRSGVVTMYRRILPAVITLTIALVIPIYLLSPAFLSIWVGPEFSHNGATVLPFLVIAFGGLAAFTIVPYYILNGLGLVRINVAMGAIYGLIVTTGTVLLLPRLGIAGAAWAHVINLIPFILGLAYIDIQVFRSRNWLPTLGYSISYLVPAFMVITIDSFLLLHARPLVQITLAASVLSILGAGICHWINARFSRMRGSVLSPVLK